MRILLIEDDECVAKALKNVLQQQNYVVDTATDGQTGWDLIQTFTYDLILLDVILPKLDGIKLCQRLRDRKYQTPVLLITAQDSSDRKVMGLDAGADDYLVKPFDMPELLARIRVLLRRQSKPILQALEWGDLRLQCGTCEVTYGDRVLHLTPNEYRLLELFLRHPQLVLSRGEILDRVWAVPEAPKEDTVTAHIKGLRQKLKQVGAPADLIETVYGLGYRLKQPAPTTKKTKLRGASLPQSQDSIQQQTKAALAEVWEKIKYQSSDRVAVLEQATISLLDNKLTEELREKARQAAHKLAGALGIFGFAKGSRLAKHIEDIWQADVILDRSEALHLYEMVMALKREIQRPSLSQLDRPLPRQQSIVMLAIDGDAGLAEQIVKLAATAGIGVKIAPNISAAKAAIAHLEKFNRLSPADVVILNLSLANTTAADLAILAELTNRTPPIPVLLCTRGDRLSDRIELSRLGVHAFLRQPFNPEEVLAAVTRLQQTRSHPTKILVVDDDPEILTLMQALLEPWGIQLNTLEEPSRFWAILEEFAPDMLVLDVEMPQFNGIDLCQIVRNEPRWHKLPVLFLTAHTDDRTIQQVFTAGANDCLSKSILGTELVTQIFNRLGQMRLMQSIQ
ncbi:MULTISPECIES: response regulator [Chroococcidiopsis]|jgi:DNA-binding response OmpR family regulator|uniref:Multi-component transcriptional regulator, winged helix family n=1 Tax=Chroococcidiopsis thermalis (strain PCC 7203) TaxID=251229 RepID=K9TWJ8_CHRTP|nr:MULTISPECIES: response regulator [Chroococcidiopsis]AFY86561.1 multi-component transcriptional regulator, winged helix family [Chroococcidiopsis thermalis PCC 7203]URD51444.1 response regulator [Chroococcidiopsis sp. CCNUC1]